MDAASPLDVQRAVELLWHAGKLAPHNLYKVPAFVALRRACQMQYPDTGPKQSLDFVLSQALYNLGFRWAADSPSQYAVAATTAAKKIDSAFRQTRSRRIHLCPLDQADKIPPRHFGPNSVRCFTAEELTELVDPFGVTRVWPEQRFDSERFSQFSWLVVEELVDLPGKPGARALPILFADLGKDYGSIQPHKPLYPQAVESAIFMLLTAPWEDITVHSDVEWRPFRAPWVYTLDDDLFAHNLAPPNPDSLSWEPEFDHDNDGETVERGERPQRLYLEDDADEKTRCLNDDAWQRLVLSEESPLLAGPVQHFFVRAFATEGIDEFLAHILVIEAALGLVTDHRKQPKLPRNPGATARVAARLSGLLETPEAGARYKELFDERSQFLHGRTMTSIPGASVLDARRLARRCVCALVAAVGGPTNPGTREAFLDGLLRRNWPPAT